MMGKKKLLLMGVFLVVICGCSRRQVVRPLDIMPQVKQTAREEVMPPKREESTKEMPPALEEETVFEIVFGEEVEEVTIPLRPEGKPLRPEGKEALPPGVGPEVVRSRRVQPLKSGKEALPPGVGPEAKAPALEEEEKEILNPRDVLRPGEELLFGIKYLGIRVGMGTLKIEGIVPLKDQLGYHLISTAKSTGIFAFIYRVNERLDSFMDLTGRYSLRFERHSYGKNPRSYITTYDQKNHLAYYEDKKIEILSNAHDPISAFYHLRLHQLKVNDRIIMNVNTGEENYKIGARVVGEKKIRTPAGEFDCLVLEPYFKDKDDPEKKTLKIYITNDVRKMPVLITSKLPFGQVVVILEEIKG